MIVSVSLTVLCLVIFRPSPVASFLPLGGKERCSIFFLSVSLFPTNVIPNATRFILEQKADQNETATRKAKPRENERSSGLQLYSSYVESDRRDHRRDKSRRSRSRSVDSKRSRGKPQVIDEEEEAIRKKLERKLREKEESYQKRLKQWEARERKKAAEYDHEREHERKRQKELQIEAQRLREFFEDYNDDIEDPKYYRGSALHQRLKDREIEEAADERDRQKEIEQIQAARRKLIEEGDPNAESIIVQMEQKMQEHLRKRLNIDGSESNTGASDSGADDTDQIDESRTRREQVSPVAPVVEKQEEETKAEDSRHASPAFLNNTNDTDKPAQSQFTSEFHPTPVDEASVSLSKDGSSTFLFAMSTEPVVRKKAAAFADEEPEEKSKKHTPSWLPPSAFKSTTVEPSSNTQNGTTDTAALVASLSAEEKKAIIKRLIDSIPTSKEDLFSFPIDWEMVDENFVNTRIKPWVDKKIISYIGEAEATFSNFICDQVVRRNPPERILSQVAMVLDEEAEVFVVKMWRLLIYVIAEKKAGLSS